MITKQEGGMDQGRLAVPGEQRDWVARNLIPSSPTRYDSFVPAERTFSRVARLRSSRGGRARVCRGRSVALKRTTRLHVNLRPALWLVAVGLCVIFKIRRKNSDDVLVEISLKHALHAGADIPSSSGAYHFTAHWFIPEWCVNTPIINMWRKCSDIP